MPNNTLGAEGRCGHVYPNGRTCGFPPGSHHGDGCQHHPFTPPVKSESVNGEAVNVAAEAQGGADVNHACPVHGWEHDYRCCPLSDTAAVERFVAEVRERREAFIQAQGIALDDPISDEAWDEANCVAFWDALRGRGFIV
jgi:hypothetical protein